ncbi:MAG: thermonuclease family protein [Ilumatobacteraceae bacterium]
MKLWPGWLVVLAAASGAVTACSPTTTANRTGALDPTVTIDRTLAVIANATIVRVVDGDTVDVDFDVDGAHAEERIRLIGIDTPETKKPNTPVQCFGPEASTFTEGLLPVGTRVRVARDVEARDDYGRLLGYLYRGADGLFVNLEIVAEGFARPLTIAPNDTFATEFVQVARDAEAIDKGLWAACSG